MTEQLSLALVVELVALHNSVSLPCGPQDRFRLGRHSVHSCSRMSYHSLLGSSALLRVML